MRLWRNFRQITPGNTLFMAEKEYNGGSFKGLVILDVSQVQKRVAQPTVTMLSRLNWKLVSTPQNATPFTSRGASVSCELCRDVLLQARLTHGTRAPAAGR